MRGSVLWHAGMVFLMACGSVFAGGYRLEVEGGGVWFGRNDVRIPGDTGTRFDLMTLTGKGPDPYVRFFGTYDIGARHALRLTLAPLEVTGTGELSEPVVFMDDEFAAGVRTRGTYKFNTYRLTYRWKFPESERWRWGAGVALLVRDARIALEQEGRRQSRSDLGFVPLLHVHGEYQVGDRMSVVLDMEGSWAPMGRAVDAAIKGRYEFRPGWRLLAGYRTLEGGADNDKVFTFAWLHHALAGIEYGF